MSDKTVRRVENLCGVLALCIWGFIVLSVCTDGGSLPF